MDRNILKDLTHGWVSGSLLGVDAIQGRLALMSERLRTGKQQYFRITQAHIDALDAYLASQQLGPFCTRLADFESNGPAMRTMIAKSLLDLWNQTAAKITNPQAVANFVPPTPPAKPMPKVGQVWKDHFGRSIKIINLVDNICEYRIISSPDINNVGKKYHFEWSSNADRLTLVSDVADAQPAFFSPEPPCHCDSKALFGFGHDQTCQYMAWKRGVA